MTLGCANGAWNPGKKPCNGESQSQNKPRAVNSRDRRISELESLVLVLEQPITELTDDVCYPVSEDNWYQRRL